MGRMHSMLRESTAAQTAFESSISHLQSILQMPHIGHYHLDHYHIAKLLLILASIAEDSDAPRAEALKREVNDTLRFLKLEL